MNTPRRRSRYWMLTVFGIAALLAALALFWLPHWIEISSGNAREDWTRRQMAGVEIGTTTAITDPVPEMIEQLASNAECADRVTQVTIGEMTGPRIGDIRFSGLKRLPHLRVLYIEYNSGNADALLSNLDGMSSLEELSLHRAHVTAEGWRHVASFPHLRRLDLDDADEGDLESIANLTQIQSLGIYNSSITARGSMSLKSLPRLEELRLGSVTITEADVPALAQLSGLRKLDLSDSSVTDEVAAKLQTALPNCRIERPQRREPAREDVRGK